LTGISLHLATRLSGSWRSDGFFVSVMEGRARWLQIPTLAEDIDLIEDLMPAYQQQESSFVEARYLLLSKYGICRLRACLGSADFRRRKLGPHVITSVSCLPRDDCSSKVPGLRSTISSGGNTITNRRVDGVKLSNTRRGTELQRRLLVQESALYKRHSIKPRIRTA